MRAFKYLKTFCRKTNCNVREYSLCTVPGCTLHHEKYHLNIKATYPNYVLHKGEFEHCV